MQFVSGSNWNLNSCFVSSCASQIFTLHDFSLLDTVNTVEPEAEAARVKHVKDEALLTGFRFLNMAVDLQIWTQNETDAPWSVLFNKNTIAQLSRWQA